MSPNRARRVARRRRKARRRADRFRTLGIVVAALGVWAGAFALIVSGSNRGSSGAPRISIAADAAAPLSDYATMLQNIAAQTPPNPYSNWAESGNSDPGKQADASNTDASNKNAKASDHAHKASPATRARVGVASASIQGPTNQQPFTAPSSTSPATPATGTAASTPTTGTTTTTVGPPGPPTGPIISVDDPRLTTAQRDAAQALIDRTTFAMAQFPTKKSVVDAGYEWIGDTDKNGFQTYVNYSYLADAHELDESRIESIVLQQDASGATKVVAAVYVLSPNQTMADVPDIAGSLTTWHARDDLCRTGSRLFPRSVDGTCPNGSLPVVLPPSLYVWMVPHTCGPFADTTVDPTTCQE